jgi:DNA-directed RNA polymerase specialized sigma24 family protein
VLVLRYYLDLGVAEISRTLRITPSAVRATNSRGLAALARLLGEERP